MTFTFFLAIMEKRNEINLVPDQFHGTQMDVIEMREFNDEQEAVTSFRKFAERLLDVNNWGKYGGISAFQLINEDGVRAERLAVKDDFIRIDIPGPGTQVGMGYDWVLIEEITKSSINDNQILAMRVRPCAHPLSQKSEIAHFLKSEATSTFMIRQVGKCVYAQEHGRNEMPNTQDGTLYDKGRNFMVGMAAKIGLSYPQWKSLVKGLLKD